MGLAGAEKQLSLEKRVVQTCDYYGSLEETLEKARKFTQALPCIPEVFQNESFSIEEVSKAVHEEPASFVTDVFLPTVFAQGKKEVAMEDGKLPGQMILKHCFFQLKVLEDAVVKAAKMHASAQKQYGDHQQSTSKTHTKKRKAAEMECNKILEDDRAQKESLLARRNQLNRLRKNIKKVKKVRAEDHLPEAGWEGIGRMNKE